MKTSTAIIFVLLFAFVAIANAQTNSTDNPIDKCIKDKNCGTDMKCIAKCAGVPDPSPKDANDTVACVSKCPQTDAKAYAACRDSCVNTIYMPTGDSGSSPSPSSSGGSSSSPSGGSDAAKTSSPGSTPSGSANGTKSAAQSLDAKHAFSNNLSMMATLLLVCVVARMTSVGF